MEGFLLSDIVKEGYVMIVKSDPSLLDNLKSAKKRYCILRRLEGGDIAIEIRKTPNDAPKRPPLKINSAQLKCTKKGKTVLEIEPCFVENEKNDKKPLMIASEDSEELSNWLLNVQRAIAIANKGDSISVCSERFEKSDRSLSEPSADSESTNSEDSGDACRDLTVWRGRNSAARVLQPPIVDRRNIFSLFYHLNASITIEPFFVHIFVFDAYAGRRISEEFCMEIGEPDDMKSIKKDCGVLDPKRELNGISEFLLANKAANKVPFLFLVICTVATPHKDLWIVCRIDRMLSADTSGDLYMKSAGDTKSTLKLQKIIQSSYVRLANYRQRFAWGARVEKAGKLTIPNASISLKVDLSVKLADFQFRVNPSLCPLRPWISPKDSPVPPVFELQSFGDIVTEPHSELVNLLYVYPLGLKLVIFYLLLKDLFLGFFNFQNGKKQVIRLFRYDNQKIFSKTRNISCKIRFVRGGDQMPTKAVIDRQCQSGLYTTYASCAVQHHQQCPSFGDEIKIRLPLTLTISDHLLFSFSHVSVAGQNNTKSPEMGETPVGYAWLPLVWKKDRLIMESDEQEFALPVAVDLPSKYFRSKPLGLGKGEEAVEIKWVDQRPLFRVRLRLACQRLENKGITGDATDLVKPKSKSMSPSASGDPIRSCSPLARSASLDEEHPIIKDLIFRTNALSDVDVSRLIPFLPVILSRLFSLLPCAPTEELALSTLSTIVSICDRCSAIGRKSLLRSFVRLHFLSKDNGEENTHGSLCKHLSVLLLSVQNNIDLLAAIYRQLWVLVDIVCKSMAQSIVHKALYKTSRKDRFSPEILDQIGNLIETLVHQYIAKHRELPDECRLANTAVAFLLRVCIPFYFFIKFFSSFFFGFSSFFQCCLSFTDRGIVFKWIYFIVQRLDDNDSRVFREYKTDVLTIITQHEHWLPLCLPVLIDSRNQIQRVNYQSTLTDTASNPASGPGFITRFFNQIFQAPVLNEVNESDRYSFCSDEWWLSSSYASRHFLVGLLLQELSACLREPRDYRRRPIALIRNMLAKHSYDKRYLDMVCSFRSFGTFSQIALILALTLLGFPNMTAIMFQNIQRRIAILYAPLIRFALEHVNELEAATTETPEVPTGLRGKYKWRSLDRRSTVPNEIPTKPLLQITGSTQFSNTPTIAPLAEKLDGHKIANYRVRGSFRTMHLVPPPSSRLPSLDFNSSGISAQCAFI
uniref:PH domain-containing protein n=1 Tax=Heterorhabditis bacteriophora TaxID=37862 RepID=A0A1I7X489_HETBA